MFKLAPGSIPGLGERKMDRPLTHQIINLLGCTYLVLSIQTHHI